MRSNQSRFCISHTKIILSDMLTIAGSTSSSGTSPRRYDLKSLKKKNRIFSVNLRHLVIAERMKKSSAYCNKGSIIAPIPFSLQECKERLQFITVTINSFDNFTNCSMILMKTTHLKVIDIAISRSSYK